MTARRSGVPSPPAPPPAWDQGLSDPEVDSRRRQFGYNELAEHKVNPLLRFFGYFWGPIPWMIEVAAALALVESSWDDLGIILVLLIVNGVVGFWEESQAGNAVAALREKLAVTARVLRGGAWTVRPARELVPGDVIRLRPGDVIPADTVLALEGEVEVDQSALTGESLPVTKHGGDTAYSSSLVAQGEANGMVRAIGAGTFFGRTAELVQTAHTTSHFQRAVLKIGNYLIVTAIALAIVIELVSIARGNDPVTSLQFALILTVAAIPVAMPTVLSVTMAVGARKMAHAQAVVTRLSAMEELAGVDVLCSDKTGTLTQNRLTLGEPYARTGVPPDAVVLAAALASRAENQDAIDLAVLGRSEPKLLSGYTVVSFHPFDPKTKRTEATVRSPAGEEFSVAKGATQVIFERTRLAGPDRERAEAAVAEFARHGFRTLGVARTDGDGGWTFLGILPLFDPLRPDAREVVGRAREMGIAVKILTGDQLAIGREVAGQLGLGTNVLPAEAARGTGPDDRSSAAEIEAADGFAQVFPEDKFAIVERLQDGGHIVGMTGDGVNDAPALKKADIGVAVSGATDVARGAASLVLLAPGLGVLVEAIAESRRIFARMTSYAIYRVGETIRILLLVSLSILAFNLYPVTAIMIVLLAVLNDGAILSIAYDRATAAGAPVRWEMRSVLLVATLLGLVGVGFTFLLFFLALEVWVLPFATIQTMIYLKLSVAGHLGIFATRSKGPFWSSRPAGILLAAVLGTQAVATTIALGGWLLTPLPLVFVAVVWGFSVADLIVFDLVKQLAYRLLLSRGASTAPPVPPPRRPHRPVLAIFYRGRFVAPSKLPASVDFRD
jgi:H+-transporting ATPase